ncbi:MAG: recombinase family protein [Boseongicola sp. SB0673_bin_14]|nr:recombinase family protein [Boseongicola sp. SB0673_bin_14]
MFRTLVPKWCAGFGRFPVLIGHARVSTTGKKPEAQIEQLRKARCERVYQEKSTGYDRKRVQLERMPSDISDADTLFVTSLDRLARSPMISLKSRGHWRLMAPTSSPSGTSGRIQPARRESSCAPFLPDFQSSNAISSRTEPKRVDSPPTSAASSSVESRNSRHINNRKWPECSTKAARLHVTSMSAPLQSIASRTLNPFQPEILPFLTTFVRTGPM